MCMCVCVRVCGWVFYLGLVSTQDIYHDLHDCLVHSQNSHQIGMLVENLVVHDVPVTTKIK